MHLLMSETAHQHWNDSGFLHVKDLSAATEDEKGRLYLSFMECGVQFNY